MQAIPIVSHSVSLVGSLTFINSFLYNASSIRVSLVTILLPFINYFQVYLQVDHNSTQHTKLETYYRSPIYSNLSGMYLIVPQNQAPLA